MSADGPSMPRPEDLLRAMDLAAALEEKETVHRAELERLLLALGEVVDSLHRLLAVAPDSAATLSSVRLITRSLEAALADAGMTPFGRVGEPADPGRYRVVGVAPVPGQDRDSVVEVVQQGYARSGRVLRPAYVIVVSNPSEET
jgi:molecular chaperone GrpE (heat shock protein)